MQCRTSRAAGFYLLSCLNLWQIIVGIIYLRTRHGIDTHIIHHSPGSNYQASPGMWQSKYALVAVRALINFWRISIACPRTGLRSRRKRKAQLRPAQFDRAQLHHLRSRSWHASGMAALHYRIVCRFCFFESPGSDARARGNCFVLHKCPGDK
jgi:hypothetical protein